MTFLSPNVGGHQQPLISGHSFAPSQKGHQQNCQVGICLNKKPRRNHTASPGSAVWDPGFSEASFAQDFSGSFQALREQLRTLLTPLFARVVICCYHIFDICAFVFLTPIEYSIEVLNLINISKKCSDSNQKSENGLRF